MMINKIKSPRAIIDSILEDIRQGKLTSGQALLSQKELCQKYNSSRGSVREALQALELVDILEIKPGVGTFVKNFSLNSFFNPAKLKYRPDDDLIPDLLDFREIFEVIVVGEAINKATEDDLRELEENLELTEFYINKENKQQFVKLDYEFHQKLTESTHNKVIKNYFETIFPLLKYSIEEILIETTKIPGVIMDSHNQHKKILESIKSRNNQKAVDNIKEHLEYVRKNFKIISQDKKQADKSSGFLVDNKI
jgi:GntR family transcriptional repressor for pyruvate dehydrogenase complex